MISQTFLNYCAVSAEEKLHNSKYKVMVGLSGGVDSSVTAFILQQQGYQVEALFMKNWEEDDDKDYCSAAQDLEDATSVADLLGIKLHTINFASEYWDLVFEEFLREYKANRTPNPDILCNKEIKFSAFLDYATKYLKADFIATGHYARLKKGNTTQLLKGLDENKDQSYFLYAVNHKQFAKSLFPLGDLHKTIVRKIADEIGLPTAKKKDSTGICFIGERKFRDFLSRYLKANQGIIRDLNGKELGTHEGLMYYTIGQRKGLNIGGVKGCENAPFYVVSKDVTNNELLVTQDTNHPKLYYKGLIANKLHWIDLQPLQNSITCSAKTRYRQADAPSTVTALDEDRIEVIFDTPQFAITEGQSIVFYQGDVCLGGAIIDKAINI